jgi:hypothetical protein
MIKTGLHRIKIVLITTLIAVQTFAQTPSLYEIKKMSFNSDYFGEISPVIVKDGIMFCSDRRFSGIIDRTTWDGHRLYNIYFAQKINGSEWSKPEELKSERTYLFNNGPLCFAPDGKTVYFTSDIETGKVTKKRSFINHSGIFIADLSGTDLLSVRPFKYNNPQYEVGQPSVSSDGRFLFFASDMPGGKGASDLYYCEFINGDWAPPVNLGSDVNSPEAENYPNMHPSGKLYFTSNRPGGFGNLDIYVTSQNDGKWESPSPLPEPLNSEYDDFAFVAEENLRTGYFSSNRSKNDDIFEFSSTIIRKASCDTIVEDSYCFRFQEENAVKFDTMPFRYEWRFGDGEKESGAVVEHCYKGPGRYIVQLDVVNLITKEVMYNEKTDTLLLTATEQPVISSPENAATGQRIMLSAESTNLPGWNIAEYYWNFDDGTVATGKEAEKIYNKRGTYNIQLIVSSAPEPGGMKREACVSKNIIVISQP